MYFVALLHCFLFGAAVAQVIRLDTYNVNPNTITVSGGSSGGAMTSQMHVIFSNKFNGAAIIAGGPYYCAEGDLGKAQQCAANPNSIDINRLATLTLNFEDDGLVDPTVNLANDRIWIFHGSLDTVVDPGVGTTIADYYRFFGVDDANIYLNMNFPCQHSLPTEDRGGPCDELNGNQAYLNLCGYEAAYELLNFLYGDLIKASSSTPLTGEYLKFDQDEFITLPQGSSMDNSGIIYVPSGCVDKTKQCHLHVVFHGCNQGQYIQGDSFALESGFCQVGELNDIIMLFPQAQISGENPMGCWDWWGYNDPVGSEGQYATNTGRQTESCGKMVDRVAGL